MSVSRSEQSRINGAKSRGPTTAGGKARSAMNSLRHGRYANNATVLSNEDGDAFEELVAEYSRCIQPASNVEYRLVSELASIDWRLTRYAAMGTRMLDNEMALQVPALESAGVAVAELTLLNNAGRAIVEHSPYPNYLLRCESQLLRARRSALAVLKEIRKNFPLADPSTQIIPPQPLNPELPPWSEPETNPECAKEVPPGSAPADSAPAGSAPEASSPADPPPAGPAPSDNPTGSSSNNSGCATTILEDILQVRAAPPDPASQDSDYPSCTGNGGSRPGPVNASRAGSTHPSSIPVSAQQVAPDPRTPASAVAPTAGVGAAQEPQAEPARAEPAAAEFESPAPTGPAAFKPLQPSRSGLARPEPGGAMQSGRSALPRSRHESGEEYPQAA